MDGHDLGAACGGGGGTALGAEAGGGSGGELTGVSSPIGTLSVKLGSRTCGEAFSASLCFALDAISVS